LSSSLLASRRDKSQSKQEAREAEEKKVNEWKQTIFSPHPTSVVERKAIKYHAKELQERHEVDNLVWLA
jgi:carbamate kinase